MYKGSPNKGKRDFNTLLRYQVINYRLRRLSTIKEEEAEGLAAAPQSAWLPLSFGLVQKKVQNILDIRKIQTNIIFDNYNPKGHEGSGYISPKFFSDAVKFLGGGSEASDSEGGKRKLKKYEINGKLQ